MSDVHLEYVNDVFCKIRTDASTLMELAEHFTYFAENYKFSPQYKNRVWDGKIRKINRLTGLVHAGLAKRIKKFCDENGYSFSFDNELAYDNVSEHELREFIKSLNLPLEVRDYQFQSILKCIRSRRRTLLSPTSSGKSLIIYIIARWYNEKTLVIVPTTGLVVQMESDFKSYGYKEDIHTSIDGLEKNINIKEKIVITTWQSLHSDKSRVAKNWYNQFDVVFGDEAHGAKAPVLIKIMEAMTHVPYRFGTTGTLDNVTLNQITIEGLFGPSYNSISTKEMIDQGFAAKFQIKCIILKYPETVAKEFHKKKPPKTPDGKPEKKTYQDEVNFIINYKTRNNFIRNLALSLDKNKLVFFRMKDHGDLLFNTFSKSTNRNVFYIDGDVKPTVREQIRLAVEKEEDAILLASLGTTSTGVSINRLHHMIAASPSKSKIKVLQSIGRMLRLHEEKDEHGAILYDIVDDLTYKSSRNFTLDHFEERIKIYDAEGFPYKIYTVGIK